MKKKATCHKQAPKFPENTYRGYTRHDFQFDENDVIVLEPHNPAPGRRWIWQVEGFGALPDFNLAMLEQGWWRQAQGLRSVRVPSEA